MLFWKQNLSIRGVSTRDLHTPNPGILRGPFATVGSVSPGGDTGGGRLCQSLATQSVVPEPAAPTTPGALLEMWDLGLHPDPRSRIYHLTGIQVSCLH